tara:strand:- start:308 stop:523 length:216 start_codon:yes stop_codon:yes gene_type:complete
MSQEKFKKLATQRVNNALKQIKLISNLANKRTYDYSDDQVRAIFNALKSEVETAQAKFKAGNSQGGNNFSL